MLTSLKSDDSRLPVVITKVYLLRWYIEAFYGFKKQQLDFQGFRVRSLQSIWNLDLLVPIAVDWIGMMSEKADERSTVMELIRISRRIYATPNFVFCAIADALFLLAAKATRGIADLLRKKPPIVLFTRLSLPLFVLKMRKLKKILIDKQLLYTYNI